MAKLRSNHSKSDNSGNIIRVGIFSAILGLLFFLFNTFRGDETQVTDAMEQVGDILDPDGNDNSGWQGQGYDEAILPTSTTGAIVRHSNYALSYSEKHEQAEWVAYELTKKSLQEKNVDRANNFRPDPKVKTKSASPYDYKRSGYDRGHMVPAADMAFSNHSMSETFYMSNMSPQVRGFNQGIWRELEENVRNWAYRFNHLYIVTGPVLTQRAKARIGNNDVSVPQAYYKVILDISEPEIKAIAYLMPNEVSKKTLDDYAVTIDEVEEVTGIDFFHSLLDEENEAALESTFDVNKWRWDKKKFNLRVDKWNKVR